MQTKHQNPMRYWDMDEEWREKERKIIYIYNLQWSGTFSATRNGYNSKSTDQFETTFYEISQSNKFSIGKLAFIECIAVFFRFTIAITIFDLVFECLLLISFKNNFTHWNTISMHSHYIRSSKYNSNLDFVWIIGLRIIRRNRWRTLKKLKKQSGKDFVSPGNFWSFPSQ